MNIRIKVTNVILSPTLQDYVNKSLAKVESIVSRDPAVQCDVELARTTAHHNKGEVYRADIHIVGSGYDAYASSEQEDLNLAITDMRDEIIRKIRSGRNKHMSYLRKSGARMKEMIRSAWPWGENGWYNRDK